MSGEMTENQIGKIVVDAAVAVHRALGPGLLETVYETVFAAELRQRGLSVERQVAVPIEYRGIRFDEGFRADRRAQGRADKAIVSSSRKSPPFVIDHRIFSSHPHCGGVPSPS